MAARRGKEGEVESWGEYGSNLANLGGDIKRGKGGQRS